MKRNPLSLRRAILILLVCFISMSIMAQKVNLDNLNIDQLNLYKDKAVKLRNKGMIATGTGVGILAAGLITTGILRESTIVDELSSPWWGLGVILVMAPAFIGMYVGIPTTLVGIPLWAIGGIKKSKAEIAIQKFNIAPENSMALGLGITIKF